MPVNLKEAIRIDKSYLIAMYKIIQENASAMDVHMTENLSETCRNACVNREQIYERKALLESLLKEVEIPGPGRPESTRQKSDDCSGCELRKKVHLYLQGHPGSVFNPGTGRRNYSDGFIRFILDLHDEWGGRDGEFCEHVMVPFQTFTGWLKKDNKTPFVARKHPLSPCIPENASVTFWQIAEDYARWEGTLRDFLKIEPCRVKVSPSSIRRVLVICKMLPQKSGKKFRYRGSVKNCQPGNILETDGKNIHISFTASGTEKTYNWQGIVDQATNCHTAIVVTDTETANGVREAFNKGCQFLGQPPQALIHDNKPIHNEIELREHIEKTTKMIPATPNRPENKANIEGEFGRYEQQVGTIAIDDSSKENLAKSICEEVLRAYTSGIDHAGRFEFDGKSRQEVLRQFRPDPEKDRKFIEQLHGEHKQGQFKNPLLNQDICRKVLDEAFLKFKIEHLDPEAKTRQWLSSRYTTEACRQGISIFGTEHAKGKLRNRTAHRYLVKVIQNCQEEIDLREQERLLLQFAEIEKTFWLNQLETEYQSIVANTGRDSAPSKNVEFQLGEKAVFGSLFLERAFWEKKLKEKMDCMKDRFQSVRNHIRRLFEATWEDRFSLINKLVCWEHQLSG